jgi:hypothetical protein
VFDLLGNWVGAWGTHGTGPGQFNAINGIAVTDSGTIFVADRGANQIKKFHVNISTAIATSVSESVPPGRSLLSQNRPNPFNPSTAIPFSLAGMGRVRIDIYDVQGRHIKTLVDRVESAGPHEALWQGDSDAGSRVGSGVYFYRMVFPNGTSGARRMILLR